MTSCISGGNLSVGVFLLLFSWKMTGGKGEVAVSLEMPRYAARGSSVTLRCVHNVQPELLYKVEWLRGESKIFQYVRERNPPFRNYSTQGSQLNMSLSNESSITLQDLEFSATGTYYCEVSLETPIYTKPSADKELLVIQPQRHPPRITFGAPLYTAGELVEANCTTSPAHPTPHITWFIDGVKVDPAMSRSYTRLAPLYRSRKRHRSARSRLHSTQRPMGNEANSNNDVGNPPSPELSNGNHSNGTKPKGCSARDVYGALDHYHRHSPRQTLQVDEDPTKQPPLAHQKPGLYSVMGATKPPPGQRLSVAVSALRLAAAGRLSLTCLATIPAYRGPSGRYADARNHTVIVDVVVAEELEPEPTEEALNAISQGNLFHTKNPILLFLLVIIALNTIVNYS